MAHHREPSIRDKGPGKGFTVRWGGKDFYLGRDRATAEKNFLDPVSSHPGSLKAYRAWLHRQHVRKAHTGVTLVDASILFLDHYDGLERTQASDYFKTHLARFLRIHGEQDLLELTTPQQTKGRFRAPIIALLEAFKSDLSNPRGELPPGVPKLKPKSINHDLGAVQRLINWCGEQGMCPDVVWKGFKKLPTRRGRPELLPIERIGELIAGVTDPRLVPYLALNYLCVARPSEVPRLMAHAGDFVPVQGKSVKAPQIARGCFLLTEHKNSWRANEDLDRMLIITDEALEWLTEAWRVFALFPATRRRGQRREGEGVEGASAGPWRSLSSYSHAAVASGFAPGPHVLRDSAASHLLAREVALEDVKIALGHLPPGEWRSYGALPWHNLRARVARISLRSSLWPASELEARVRAFLEAREMQTALAIRRGIAKRDRKRRPKPKA